jgi:hypothetical protein
MTDTDKGKRRRMRKLQLHGAVFFFFEKLIVPELIKNSPHFIEFER